MAIDYKKEWKKLHNKHGNKNIRIAGNLHKLHEVMNKQIDETIVNREILMRAYVEEEMITDITGGNKNFHFVRVDTQWGTFGTICVSKKDFAKWCEEEGDK